MGELTPVNLENFYHLVKIIIYPYIHYISKKPLH